MDGGNAQPSSDLDINGTKMSCATKGSIDRSPFGSGQSGLANIGDIDAIATAVAATQRCQASSQNSAQSNASLKARDYIGLSEVSSRAVRAPGHAPASLEGKPGEGPNLGLQETELRLGLPQPVSAPKACENEEKVVASLAYTQEQGDAAMQHKFGRGESFKTRCAGNNVHVWDLGIGFNPKVVAYPEEEVGENKVCCGVEGGRALKPTTAADLQEHASKNQEKIPQVFVVVESSGDERKSLPPKVVGHVQQDMELARQKQLLKGTVLATSGYGQYSHEGQGTSHLREVSAAQKFWQAQVTSRAANGLHLPRGYEPQSTQFSQDLENSKGGYGRAANGIQGARVLPIAARNAIAGSKRGFSEAIGGDEATLNGTAKLANSTAADSESYENTQLKQQLPVPRFSWNSTKQSFASWPPGLENSVGAAPFGPFKSSGQNLIKGDTNTPRENHFEGLPGKSTVITKKSQAEAGHGQQDVQDTVENEKIASTPRAPVGWPPVQSFRKNSLPPPKPKKPVDTEVRTAVGAPPSVTAVVKQLECLFVKVYMDGLPIGRKVDLSFYDNYEKLSSALEDMFQGFFNGQSGAKGPEGATSSKGKKLNLLRYSDYVITYEDKDGDLMLVGDVPWGIFLSNVKRLRIMKHSEAIGLAPGSGDKIKCS